MLCVRSLISPWARQKFQWSAFQDFPSSPVVKTLPSKTGGMENQNIKHNIAANRDIKKKKSLKNHHHFIMGKQSHGEIKDHFYILFSTTVCVCLCLCILPPMLISNGFLFLSKYFTLDGKLVVHRRLRKMEKLRQSRQGTKALWESAEQVLTEECNWNAQLYLYLCLSQLQAPQPGAWLYLVLFQRRQWHPTPVLLPGKCHGRRSLVGCSPWGH